MTRKDIAIIGGAFDPVHNGHIEMVKYFVDNFIVDEVWILPSYISPHKDIDKMASYEDRVAMLNLSINNISSVYVNTFEKDYYNNIINGNKTYTYEVLETMKKKYLNSRFHFVVGFDSIKNINKWHRYQELIRDYWFYIFDREDDEFKTIEEKKFYLNNLGKRFGINFTYELFDCKILNISSTEIRELLKDITKNRKLLLQYLDPRVLQYIEDNRLYGIHQ